MGRVYSPEEKATGLAHLAAEGGNVKRAARVANVPRKTLQGWRDGRGITGEVTAVIEESKLRLRDMYRDEAEAALEEAKAKRGAANYKDLMIGAAVATDKMQLLSGEATSRVEHRGETARAAFDRLVELYRRKHPEISPEQIHATLLAQRPALAEVLPAA
jgi:transposase-like protein